MTLVQLIPLLVTVPLVVFWLWMFKDFANNYEIPRAVRTYWLAAFLFLNILTAIYYYFTEYDNGRG